MLAAGEYLAPPSAGRAGRPQQAKPSAATSRRQRPPQPKQRGRDRPPEHQLLDSLTACVIPTKGEAAGSASVPGLVRRASMGELSMASAAAHASGPAHAAGSWPSDAARRRDLACVRARRRRRPGNAQQACVRDGLVGAAPVLAAWLSCPGEHEVPSAARPGRQVPACS